MVLPHGHYLRKGRVTLPGHIYLVTTVTHDRKPIFGDFFLGRRLIKVMRDHADRGDVDSLAFVIMPDHLHWLFALTGNCDLSTFVGNVKGTAAREIRRVGAPSGAISAAAIAAEAAPTGGPLWQAGFYDRALRREEDLKLVARYIVMNPVRAGLVKRVWDYPLWDAIWVL